MVKKILSVFLLIILSSCALLDPNSKGFSEVFNTVYTTYQIQVDANDYPTMNYQLALNFNTPTIQEANGLIKFNSDSLYFNYLELARPLEPNGTSEKKTFEGYFDFKEGFLYYYFQTFEVNNATQETKLISDNHLRIALGDNSIQQPLDVAPMVKSILEESVLTKLGNPAVDLIIGKSSLVDGKYSFQLNIGQFLDTSFVEPFLGFVPSGITMTLEHVPSNLDAMINFDFTQDDKAYSLDLTLTRDNEVQTSETHLTELQKQQYTAS